MNESSQESDDIRKMREFLGIITIDDMLDLNLMHFKPEQFKMFEARILEMSPPLIENGETYEPKYAHTRLSDGGMVYITVHYLWTRAYKFRSLQFGCWAHDVGTVLKAYAEYIRDGRPSTWDDR